MALQGQERRWWQRLLLKQTNPSSSVSLISHSFIHSIKYERSIIYIYYIFSLLLLLYYYLLLVLLVLCSLTSCFCFVKISPLLRCTKRITDKARRYWKPSLPLQRNCNQPYCLSMRLIPWYRMSMYIYLFKYHIYIISQRTLDVIFTLFYYQLVFDIYRKREERSNDLEKRLGGMMMR